MKYTELTEDKKRKGYTGYKLPENERYNLTLVFPPKYSKFIGHHVTHKFGVTSDQVPPKGEYKIVGYADSGDGLEALVVSINGNIKRPDNSLYHVTWSLDPEKYKPKDSNALVQSGYKDLESPITVSLEPTFFPFRWIVNTQLHTP